MHLEYPIVIDEQRHAHHNGERSQEHAPSELLVLQGQEAKVDAGSQQQIKYVIRSAASSNKVTKTGKSVVTKAIAAFPAQKEADA